MIGLLLLLSCIPRQVVPESMTQFNCRQMGQGERRGHPCWFSLCSGPNEAGEWVEWVALSNGKWLVCTEEPELCHAGLDWATYEWCPGARHVVETDPVNLNGEVIDVEEEL